MIAGYTIIEDKRMVYFTFGEPKKRTFLDWILMRETRYKLIVNPSELVITIDDETLVMHPEQAKKIREYTKNKMRAV